MLTKRLVIFQLVHRFPVQKGVSLAFLMLDGPSAESLKSVARILG